MKDVSSLLVGNSFKSTEWNQMEAVGRISYVQWKGFLATINCLLTVNCWMNSPHSSHMHANPWWNGSVITFQHLKLLVKWSINKFFVLYFTINRHEVWTSEVGNVPWMIRRKFKMKSVQEGGRKLEWHKFWQKSKL